MVAIVTRVASADVKIDGKTVGAIGKGFLVLLGVAQGDGQEQAVKLADKVCGVRVFEDENGKMNLNLQAAGGELLVVSQFTLLADCRQRRPGFSGAAKPEKAVPFYELFIDKCREKGFHVETGVFGADMKVSSVNDGPVTLIMDTDRL